MKLYLSSEILNKIHLHGENAYPEEGAGLLFGENDGGLRIVRKIYPLNNSRELESRHNRYLISSRDMLEGDQEAEKLNLEIVGIFHSHPDHHDQPSEFDRDWALPWFSYIITSVKEGIAKSSQSWRLSDDRSMFKPEELIIESDT